MEIVEAGVDLPVYRDPRVEQITPRRTRSQLICKPFGKAAALIELHHQRNKDVQLAHLTEF